ncbi:MULTISPECIES: DUF5316 family protein [Virgibacillus]|uniref:Cytochrome c biogenesis protein ResB n=2 Tax=Virgibacillus TaxID=84406 RepID=A0A024Q844_9BACI|nr:MULTISPECIES: DUF5316 family protein [Virgibacillus]EQB38394.1 hypothetical protein M948_07380 [Virgibacillus sp. CM-4]MYL41100.1 hypothetical protein [Virgibacillus massiliensis]GGJ54282.1 hypothetical protein GCM10007111_15620 [Virgibacillus kapii]CDQ38096.1 hypothetical protein BN990_00363 [Virgibacillus massiliensis]
MLKIITGIGVIAILISATFLGIWTSGLQQRANYQSETREHREFRTKIGLYSGLIGLIFLGIAGLIWYF